MKGHDHLGLDRLDSAFKKPTPVAATNAQQ
jgi:hypothetical protein